MVLSRLTSWKGVEWTSHMFTASTNRDSAWGNPQRIWTISWWVISSLMPSIFRICVSKAWESKMWSRLCYTYIYVHASCHTINHWKASLSLYAAVKTNLPHKPGESSMQCESCHFQKNMLDPNPKIFDLDHLLLHPPSEIPCHNAQRKFAMDAWKGWNQPSWNHPIHGHCMSNPQARKTSQNILSFQRTWKRHGRRLNFVIFLTTCILPCETVHDIFTNIHRACPARGSLYHIIRSI